jgi:selenocysteine-specific elongation factor
VARDSDGTEPPPRRPLLHIGAAAVPAYLRPLAQGVVRLTLARPLPLRVGDRALLRDPGSRRIWGATVLDPAPPPLDRRGAARSRAAALAGVRGRPDLRAEVDRRGEVDLRLLRQIGVPVTAADEAAATHDGWLVSERRAAELSSGLEALVRREDARDPLRPGVTLASLADRLGAASPHVVAALVRPPLRLAGGRVTATAEGSEQRLPDRLERAVSVIEADLREEPFAAPTAGRLQELGLTPQGVTAAARAGRLLHLGEGIVLLPQAEDQAVELLRGLPQPFRTAEARERLGTSRRVVLPLLAQLDRRGRTRRLPDDRRLVVR